MQSPHIHVSRIGILLLMLGLSVPALGGLACSSAGASPASEAAPATMKELTLAVSGMT